MEVRLTERLVQLRLVRTRVNLEENIPLVHQVAFLEPRGCQVARDTGPQVHACGRLGPAGEIFMVCHFSNHRPGDRNFRDLGGLLGSVGGPACREQYETQKPNAARSRVHDGSSHLAMSEQARSYRRLSW